MQIVFWMTIVALVVSFVLGTCALVFNVRLICLLALNRESQSSAVFACPFVCFIIAGACFTRCFPGIVIGKYVCMGLLVMDLIVELFVMVVGRRSSPTLEGNARAIRKRV